MAKLIGAGGAKAVLADRLPLKHQAIVIKRTGRKALNFNTFDRLFLGLYSMFIHANRIAKLAVIIQASTLLKFHQALLKRKYHLLFSAKHVNKPGPKGLRLLVAGYFLFGLIALT